MDEYKKLEIELQSLYEELPTLVQRLEIKNLHVQYREEAVKLMIKYMKKEIDTLKSVKMKLSV